MFLMPWARSGFVSGQKSPRHKGRAVATRLAVVRKRAVS